MCVYTTFVCMSEEKSLYFVDFFMFINVTHASRAMLVVVVPGLF